jgi:type I restriction enzyme S subunit
MSFRERLLGDLLTFQRGFDITKAEQSSGEVPIVSSSGVSSFHNEAKVSGPGVVIGRKGTLGTVHYIEQDFWPHDTTPLDKGLQRL